MKSFEKLKPSPTLLSSDNNRSTFSLPLSQCETMVEKSKSVLDSLTPPAFTRTKISKTSSIVSVSTS